MREGKTVEGYERFQEEGRGESVGRKDYANFPFSVGEQNKGLRGSVG